ncbi:MAG: mannitol dehydrogenase family protein [Oceanicaulis sp.]|uniref:mannitol dehydrogenase family protein n=1 Tax=Glycocaulis sp. TaxID=1969725 RepID=UPI0025C0E9D4|nr:mannitol dehydrogenase family protein [Glycocaulis sp.]MCC5980365.1 mannitol dehydrogenase family protein [Oceanicaulis sp.]MCH8522891.1 mannitol dehydrogenase family protein [Glycocaulis sp.]
MRARLNAAALAHLPAGVKRPAYDRSRVQTGIVHIGPGAFHRAHQAAYIDQILASDPRWGIAAMALRSRDITGALNAQDELYTLQTLGEGEETRVIGSILSAQSGARGAEPLLDTLTLPTVKLVTLTITEKGYCLASDGALDAVHPDIAHDLAHPKSPKSAIGLILEALTRRRAQGLPPFHVLSCDNLSDNGVKLAGAVTALAAERDRGLASWIAGEVRFPRTMVDAITPATDGALKAHIAQALGYTDAVPVQREVFTSWVIEKSDIAPFPDLEAAGALMTDDVAGHAFAKLRLLNGCHSPLAWLGLACGYESVNDAMADPWLARFITRLAEDEIAPSIAAPDGMDLSAYAATIRARFANPAIRHLLSQIAWDSSQKLPVRLLSTVENNLSAGRDITLLTASVASWMRFVRRMAASGQPLTDPMAAELAAIGLRCNDDPDHDVTLFLSLDAIFRADLATNARFRAGLIEGYDLVRRLETGARPSCPA